MYMLHNNWEINEMCSYLDWELTVNSHTLSCVHFILLTVDTHSCYIMSTLHNNAYTYSYSIMCMLHNNWEINQVEQEMCSYLDWELTAKGHTMLCVHFIIMSIHTLTLSYIYFIQLRNQPDSAKNVFLLGLGAHCQQPYYVMCMLHNNVYTYSYSIMYMLHNNFNPLELARTCSDSFAIWVSRQKLLIFYSDPLRPTRTLLRLCSDLLGSTRTCSDLTQTCGGV